MSPQQEATPQGPAADPGQQSTEVTPAEQAVQRSPAENKDATLAAAVLHSTKILGEAGTKGWVSPTPETPQVEEQAAQPSPEAGDKQQLSKTPQFVPEQRPTATWGFDPGALGETPEGSIPTTAEDRAAALKESKIYGDYQEKIENAPATLPLQPEGSPQELAQQAEARRKANIAGMDQLQGNQGGTPVPVGMPPGPAPRR